MVDGGDAFLKITRLYNRLKFDIALTYPHTNTPGPHRPRLVYGYQDITCVRIAGVHLTAWH
jgi:hypothetical protein